MNRFLGKEVGPREKLSSREKLTPISSVTSTTPGGNSQKNQENKSQKDFFSNTLQSELNQTSKSAISISENKITPKTQKNVKAEHSDEKLAENNLKKALLNQKGRMRIVF